MKSRIQILFVMAFTILVVHGQNNRSQAPIEFDAEEMLHLVNQARMENRRCGGKKHKATHPLKWNEALARAAQKHANDMGDKEFFSHEGSGGSTVVMRVEREDYQWRAVGENVAMGQRSVEQVVEGWLDSPGHCSNIMNPDFTEMGAAVSDKGEYWVQVFAAPRDASK